MGSDIQSGNGGAVHPAALPGIRGTLELCVAFFGELTPHPWQGSIDDDVIGSLFIDRSLSMGWLDSADVRFVPEPDEITGRVGRRAEPESKVAGLWRIHEAAHHSRRRSTEPPVLWVQVGIKQLRDSWPLPTQPLLNCVEDVAARIGTLRLDAVQFLLPAQPLFAASQGGAEDPILDTAGWFACHDADARTPVAVTLDGGRDPVISSVASQMWSWMEQADQDVFECESLSLTTHDDFALRPMFGPPSVDERGADLPHCRVTFRGTLAEWSPDAIGWMAAFLAEACAWHEVATPLILTVHQVDR